MSKLTEELLTQWSHYKAEFIAINKLEGFPMEAVQMAMAEECSIADFMYWLELREAN